MVRGEMPPIITITHPLLPSHSPPHYTHLWCIHCVTQLPEALVRVSHLLMERLSFPQSVEMARRALEGTSIHGIQKLRASYVASEGLRRLGRPDEANGIIRDAQIYVETMPRLYRTGEYVSVLNQKAMLLREAGRDQEAVPILQVCS